MNIAPETIPESHTAQEPLEALVLETELKQGVLHRLGSIATTAGNHIAEVAKPTRRKLALLGVMVSAGGVVETSLAGVSTAKSSSNNGAVEVIHNPVQYEGHPMSCPDPNVFRWAGKFIASCTSDYGQDNPLPGGGMGRYPAAFPIYESSNLKNWSFKNYIFPPGHHPQQAIPPEGNWPGARYWADEIHHFGDRYVAYFATQMTQGTINWINRQYHESLKPRTIGIFEADSKHLFSGNWHSKLLHFPGQFNTVRGNAADYTAADAQPAQANNLSPNSQEISGGVIDPSVTLDPATGQLLMVYAKQSDQIFISELTPDGLTMKPRVHFAFGANLPWECTNIYTGYHCIVEGPVIEPDPVNKNVMTIKYNAASTWNGSYKIGIAASTDPFRKWTKYPKPILQSGNGLFDPGIGSQSFTGPDGNPYMAFHAQTHTNHYSQQRYLSFGRLHYNTGNEFLIPDTTGTARNSNVQPPTSRKTTPVSLPQMGSGIPRRSIVVGG